MQRVLMVGMLILTVQSAEKLVLDSNTDLLAQRAACQTQTTVTTGDAQSGATLMTMVVGKARASTRGIHRPVSQEPACTLGLVQAALPEAHGAALFATRLAGGQNAPCALNRRI